MSAHNPDCDDSSCSTDSDDSAGRAHLSCFRVWFSQLVLWETRCILEPIDMRILILEHTVNVTAVFTWLEGNDDDPINVVFNSLVGVNHMLETYLFRKTDLEYAVPDLQYSIDAHPFETIMKLQD